MRSKWRPCRLVIGGKLMYIAGRVKDVSRLAYDENIEFIGGYSPYKIAIKEVCDALNKSVRGAGQAIDMGERQ